MKWEIEYTDEFGAWWAQLSESELLIGGNKGGDGRFYARMIPIADRLYDTHLEEQKKEGLLQWPVGINSRN